MVASSSVAISSRAMISLVGLAMTLLEIFVLGFVISGCLYMVSTTFRFMFVVYLGLNYLSIKWGS